jgi:hypothetical protein
MADDQNPSGPNWPVIVFEDKVCEVISKKEWYGGPEYLYDTAWSESDLMVDSRGLCWRITEKVVGKIHLLGVIPLNETENEPIPTGATPDEFVARVVRNLRASPEYLKVVDRYAEFVANLPRDRVIQESMGFLKSA